jgi:PII-like signaling protein
MTTINQDRIIGLFAPARYGKTTGIANLVQRIPIQVIVYDTNHEWENSPQLRGLVMSRQNILIAQPKPGRERDPAFLNEFIRNVRAEMTNCFIYIEDIEVFYTGAASRNEFHGEIKDVAERGGHQRIGLIYSAKQLKYIPPALISNTNLFYFGQFMDADDVNEANGLLRPEFDTRQLTRPWFVEVDRWTSSKRKVMFEKVF